MMISLKQIQFLVDQTPEDKLQIIINYLTDFKEIIKNACPSAGACGG